MTIHALCHDCQHQHTYRDVPLAVAAAQWHAKHAGHQVELRHRRGWLRRAVTSLLLWLQLPPRVYGYTHNADVKMAYAASADEGTLTALNGLAASATHVAGWESTAIDNTTNKYLDYRVTAKITVQSSGLSAGEIRLYLVGMLDDSTWPDVFDGTASAETVTDTEIRDAICRLGAATATDTTVSRVYYLDCPSVAAVFGGNLPKKFVIFITQSTGTTLETTGNQVTVVGSYLTVA